MDNTKIKVYELNLEIISEKKQQKGRLAYFRKFDFKSMIDWVWRNCQGCDKVEIEPNKCVQVTYPDRIEIYTYNQTVTIENNVGVL